MTEFKDALGEIESARKMGIQILTDQSEKAIRRALRIADRLMQEPSSGFPSMKQKGASAMHTFVMHQVAGHEEAAVIFKAMRDQMLREIDNADGDGV